MSADKAVATYKSPVKIICKASGIPQPQYLFYHINGSSQTLVSDGDSKTSGKLSIPSINFDADYKAIYICIPSNKIGIGEGKNVSVEVEGK